MIKEQITRTENAEPTLFLIGLDDRMTQLLISMRLATQSFVSPEEFLAEVDLNCFGCIISDVAFKTGSSGFLLLRSLRERQTDLPVILVSSMADMSLALTAVSEGAVTLLTTSCDTQTALEAVERALQINRDRRITGSAQRKVLSLISRLSERESQVLKLMADGFANKQIAAELNVSLRSIEKWRKDGLDKMQVESPLQLLRILMLAGFRTWPNSRD
jgi:FixJ family two-component response regulator